MASSTTVPGSFGDPGATKLSGLMGRGLLLGAYEPRLFIAIAFGSCGLVSHWLANETDRIGSALRASASGLPDR